MTTNQTIATTTTTTTHERTYTLALNDWELDCLTDMIERRMLQIEIAIDYADEEGRDKLIREDYNLVRLLQKLEDVQ